MVKMMALLIACLSSYSPEVAGQSGGGNATAADSLAVIRQVGRYIKQEYGQIGSLKLDAQLKCASREQCAAEQQGESPWRSDHGRRLGEALTQEVGVQPTTLRVAANCPKQLEDCRLAKGTVVLEVTGPRFPSNTRAEVVVKRYTPDPHSKEQPIAERDDLLVLQRDDRASWRVVEHRTIRTT